MFYNKANFEFKVVIKFYQSPLFVLSCLLIFLLEEKECFYIWHALKIMSHIFKII